MLDYLKDWRIWLTCLIIVCFLVMCDRLSFGEDQDEYWIEPGKTVLAFVGQPYSLNVKPVKLTTYEKQKIILFHKDSGPGIYAFYLQKLIVVGKDGEKTKIHDDGYFLVKRKWISRDYWMKKTSLKEKTRKW